MSERQRAGDAQAREALIERYLPLARKLALRYRHSPEPLDDLIQVASLGLVKATDRWDPNRGFAFSTYAAPTILGELRRYFRDRTWAVRPPRELAELAFAIERARERLTAGLGREPTAADFATHLDRPRSEIVEALRVGHAHWAMSLEAQVSDELPAVAEFVTEADHGYDEVEGLAVFDWLLAPLAPLAREVLRLRFDAGLRQSEIARRVGYSQVHVSRILRSALTTLAAHVHATDFGYELVG
ncbi:sigma-70 family RNA polymerase sigma factor [Solirubrobacter ginsenosidimutans]|uniref:Sigma-70 family RNA polymerase sigma factor n=1 Tax=Solirubrobacter ginsenosidimutans TaxID=490573 RepID=A0A9X3MQF7_9ACTN|nr:sigma-70 family RNA polymerase sigma factor [Solirubrobacter ginsenosidimutans]MDA0159911.1 sigma-70 family RNA polymerase sigma factor [Solirubrobacter ginsenosidimutans]